MIRKLFNYLFRDTVFEILKNYFDDWRQFLKFWNKISNLLELTIGVPQCSVFRPILILIYLKDLLLHKTRESKIAIDEGTTSMMRDIT